MENKPPAAAAPHGDNKMRLTEMAMGFMPSTIILTACVMGVFEALGRERRATADLAAELKLDLRALETVLLALVGVDIVQSEDAGASFRINPAYAPYLLRGGPGSQAAILSHAYDMLRRWVQLDETLRTGKPAPRADWRDEQSAWRDFIEGMNDVSREDAQEAAKRYDASRHKRLIDIGGGPATYALAFAKANPALHAVVFDLPETVQIARKMISAAGMESRVTTQEGDLFKDDFGAGYDLAYISNIIHMMDADATRNLIARGRKALAPGGAMVFKDFFLNADRTHPPFAAMFSVNMLAGTERGRSYTLDETRAMAEAEGFTQFDVIELNPRSRLLVCRLPA